MKIYKIINFYHEKGLLAYSERQQTSKKICDYSGEIIDYKNEGEAFQTEIQINDTTGSEEYWYYQEIQELMDLLDPKEKLGIEDYDIKAQLAHPYHYSFFNLNSLIDDWLKDKNKENSIFFNIETLESAMFIKRYHVILKLIKDKKIKPAEIFDL